MNHRENIDRSFDGQLSQTEWDALQQAVLADPDLRREYVEKRWIHALLETESEALPSLFAEAVPTPSAKTTVRRRAAGEGTDKLAWCGKRLSSHWQPTILAIASSGSRGSRTSSMTNSAGS